MLILRLFGLGVLGLHLFLGLGRVRLMSVVRLLMRLVFGLLFLWVRQLDYLLLIIVVLLVLDLMLGLCKSRSLGLRSQYIRSFSIIGGLLFLQ